MAGPRLTRRSALAGAGAVALAACSARNPPAGPPTVAAGETLAQLSDIPVGEAVAAETADGDPIVVAQPSEGQAVAFSAICTHQGCTVRPDDERLVCPCHGSVFDATTGEVLQGPAERPLPQLEVRVENGAVVAGA